MTADESKALAEFMDAVEETVLAIRAEVKSLRAETMRYRGVWAGQAATYSKGDCVTRDGCLWVCSSLEPTNEKPGTGDGWQLAHKPDR